MQVANNDHQYTATHGRFRLQSKILTEVEHDVAVRRADGLSHKEIARELGCSVKNSSETARRVMNKVVPNQKWSDVDRPRTIQDLIKGLLDRKELTFNSFSVIEWAWIGAAIKVAGLLDSISPALLSRTSASEEN
jgi:DNA-binding CsgD family transcriptional regulator